MDPSIPGWEQIAVPLLARDGYVVLRIRGGGDDDDDGSSSLAPQADVAEIIKYAQQQQQQQQGGGQEQEQEEQKQQKGGKAISLATECSAAHALLAHPAIMSLCNGVLGRQVLRKDRAGLEASLAPPSLFTDGRTYIPVYTCM